RAKRRAPTRSRVAPITAQMVRSSTVPPRASDAGAVVRRLRACSARRRRQVAPGDHLASADLQRPGRRLLPAQPAVERDPGLVELAQLVRSRAPTALPRLGVTDEEDGHRAAVAPADPPPISEPSRVRSRS